MFVDQTVLFSTFDIILLNNCCWFLYLGLVINPREVVISKYNCYAPLVALPA